MNRGDLVTVALSGDYGKPRPAVIVQSDVFGDTASVVVLPITSDLSQPALLRVSLDPDAENGLRKPSQIMIDKIASLPRRRVGASFGRLKEETMFEVTQALALFLGFV